MIALWKPIGTEFFGRKHPVEVACVGDAGEANRLRALLEGLGAAALCHWIGTPTDFLKVIPHGTKAAPYLIVPAHGNDNGIVFGEYAEAMGTTTASVCQATPGAVMCTRGGSARQTTT